MQAAACGAYNSITEADIDGDGKLDVIALGLEGISVFRGNGDGTLQSCRKLDSAPTSHIIAKDFDGDGNIDLIAAVLYSTELRLLRGTGGGTFAPPVVIPLPDTFLAWALGDANGDSIPDLLVATSHIAVATLIVFRGSRDGPFTLGSSMSLGMSTVAASARWNLVFSNDPDGKPRLLVLDGSTIEILIGDGHGGFAKIAKDDHGFFYEEVFADFNRDGYMDMAGIIQTKPFIAFGTESGLRLLPFPGPFPAIELRLATADVNDDGFPDVIGVSSGLTVVMLNQKDGTFGSPSAYFTSLSSVLVGDFTGDGIADLVVGGGAAGVPVL
ncbi:MAG: hypothetical protein DMF57_18020, partial [Acidobacteria bacterium]